MRAGTPKKKACKKNVKKLTHKTGTRIKPVGKMTKTYKKMPKKKK